MGGRNAGYREETLFVESQSRVLDIWASSDAKADGRIPRPQSVLLLGNLTRPIRYRRLRPRMASTMLVWPSAQTPVSLDAGK